MSSPRRPRTSSVGRALPHESAVGHVTGAALYTDDLAGRFAELLHAWPVMSPHAHAEIRSVDTEQAAALDGVEAVLTAADVPGINDTGPARRDEPLFPSVAHYEGQPVVWVLGRTLSAAKRGAAAVVVEYEARPATLTIEQAISQNHFHTEPLRIERGEPDRAFEVAKHVLEGELFVGGQEHFYLETQAAIAVQDESGHMLVHSSTQHPAETQEICARVLGVARSHVTCQSLRMGGAFGGKEVQANPYAAVAVVGAHKTGLPVRVRLDRQLDMAATGKRHPYLGRWRVAFAANGKLSALEMQLYSDGGYSLDLSEPVMFRSMFHVDNAYHLPNVRVVGRVCKTNTTSHTAFRGFGGPQGMVVTEDALDAIARHLSLPPHVVRERNFYTDGDTAHYGQTIKDADRIARIWNELRADSEFDGRWTQVARFNSENSTRKRGLAITPVEFGISFTTAFFNQAGALVLIFKDGSVQLNHGGTEMGRGLHTKMLQVAADGLGVPIGAVRVMPTRTDKVPNTSATAASSGSDLNGAAVRDACETLRARLAEVAGREFGVPPDDVVFDNGRIYPFNQPQRRLRFAEVCEKAYLSRVPLFATGYYRTPKIAYDRDEGRGTPFHYFAYGAAVSEVEVDGFTGMYELRRVDILHDVGNSLSPLVDRGQIEGGFIQGMGWLTCEELKWSSRGRLLTRGASTYKLPSLGECPRAFHVRMLPRAAESGVIYGSKAVGEPPFMLAISVREALRHAAGAFADVPGAGPVQLACPSTPEAVWRAIRSQS